MGRSVLEKKLVRVTVTKLITPVTISYTSMAWNATEPINWDDSFLLLHWLHDWLASVLLSLRQILEKAFRAAWPLGLLY